MVWVTISNMHSYIIIIIIITTITTLSTDLDTIPPLPQKDQMQYPFQSGNYINFTQKI
jgi:hypothetical protein